MNDATDPRAVAEGLFRAFLESAPDAMVVVRGDGTIFLANTHAEGLFGYAREELVGQPVEVLVPEALRAEHAEHRRAFFAQPRLRAMGDGRELFGLRKDGTAFPVEISLSPIETPDGVLVSSAVRDVSRRVAEQKAAEEARLRAREAELGAILERSLNEIYVFDARTLRFLEVNEGARRNLGYALEELRELTPIELMDGYDGVRFAELVAPLRAGDSERLGFETAHRRRDGSVYPAEVHLQLSTLRARPVFVAIVLDATDRKRAEQSLARWNEELQRKVDEKTAELEAAHAELVTKERFAALGQLAGGVAHEIRTPLGVISNTVYYLKMLGEALDEDARDAVADIEREVATASRIVAELLDYVRTPKMNVAPLSAHAAMQSAAAAIELPESVSLEHADGDVRVLADASQIERVLTNLIRNAVQAMPDGGRLRLRAVRDGDAGILEVGDTGVGIAPQDLAKIFEPLYTTKARGIGLGLSVARRYAELNAGRLEVSSTPGQGTTFRLVLPVLESPP